VHQLLGKKIEKKRRHKENGSRAIESEGDRTKTKCERTRTIRILDSGSNGDADMV